MNFIYFLTKYKTKVSNYLIEYYKNKSNILKNYKTKKIDIHTYIWIKLNATKSKIIQLKQEKKQTSYILRNH